MAGESESESEADADVEAESDGGGATDAADLEELKQRHQKGSCVSGAARGQGEGTETSELDDVDPLEAAIVRAFKRLDAGDAPKSLSLRDGQLAALIHGLETDPEDFTAVGVALQEALGREADPAAIDRSEVLQLAIRVGLREAAPEAIETARDAQVRHVTEQF